MILEALSAAGLGPEGAAFWLILAAFLWGVLAWHQAHHARQRGSGLKAELDRVRLSLAGAREQAQLTDQLNETVQALQADKSGLQAQMAALQARLHERERAVEEQRQRLNSEFQVAASKLLETTHQSFLERANETFARHREVSGAEAEKKRRALDELIRPMSETLTRYEKGLSDMRAEQQKHRGELVGKITDLAKSAHDVRLEAQKLSTALRAGPKTRGRWGEEQLRNVVETAGMSAYVDFVEQASFEDEARRKQPDMVVNLPGGRKIAVDSKVSLGAYLDALEAETDLAREAHFARHADDLWAHVKSLSMKDYAASIRESLDIVIMFVPGENYFAAAVDAKPQLFQDAFDRKVLIATPTTLVAMLKAASFNWRQEKAAENATRVAGLAKDLYDSLKTMSGNIADLGKALDRAVGKYNSTVGGLERRVLPRARKFAEYELPGVDAPIEEVPMIETTPQALKAMEADTEVKAISAASVRKNASQGPGQKTGQNTGQADLLGDQPTDNEPPSGKDAA